LQPTQRIIRSDGIALPWKRHSKASDGASQRYFPSRPFRIFYGRKIKEYTSCWLSGRRRLRYRPWTYRRIIQTELRCSSAQKEVGRKRNDRWPKTRMLFLPRWDREFYAQKLPPWLH